MNKEKKKEERRKEGWDFGFTIFDLRFLTLVLNSREAFILHPSSFIFTLHPLIL